MITKLQHLVARTIKLAHIKTKKVLKLCNKHAIVREGPSYPRNNTPMGMSLLALAYFVMKPTIRGKARQNIILLLSYGVLTHGN